MTEAAAWSAKRIVQRVVAQFSDTAMSETERHSGDILAVQSNYGGEYVDVGTVKQSVSQLLPNGLMDSLPTVEKIGRVGTGRKAGISRAAEVIAKIQKNFEELVI